jgi:hypothetical protein
MWLAEQQALDAIDDRLKADDPGLGSLFGIFTRLTGHEEMPTVERLDAAARRAAARRRRRRAQRSRGGTWRSGRSADWSWAARVVPVALAAVLGVLFLVLAPGSHGPCRPAQSGFRAWALSVPARCVARTTTPVPRTRQP